MDIKIRPAVSNGAPFAKSALEIAFLDLAGKITGQPLHALLGGKVHDTIDLCYAVSIDEPAAMADEVNALARLLVLQGQGLWRRRQRHRASQSDFGSPARCRDLARCQPVVPAHRLWSVSFGR